MEMKLQVPFQQLITIVKMLTPAQKARLKKELEVGEPAQKSNDDFIDFLLKGPVYSEKEMAVVEENIKSIAAWRTKS